MKRSSTDKVLLGVCGGLGQYLSIDPFFVRIGVVLATLSTGLVPGLIIYFIAGCLMVQE